MLVLQFLNLLPSRRQEKEEDPGSTSIGNFLPKPWTQKEKSASRDLPGLWASIETPSLITSNSTMLIQSLLPFPMMTSIFLSSLFGTQIPIQESAIWLDFCVSMDYVCRESVFEPPYHGLIALAKLFESVVLSK
jgi:hypothetical protein